MLSLFFSRTVPPKEKLEDLKSEGEILRPFMISPEAEFLDNILTKIFKSIPLSYSQSPLQLCLEISISSNSSNLLQFLQLSYCAL
jgi:hypothetical protein